MTLLYLIVRGLIIGLLLGVWLLTVAHLVYSFWAEGATGRAERRHAWPWVLAGPLLLMVVILGRGGVAALPAWALGPLLLLGGTGICILWINLLRRW